MPKLKPFLFGGLVLLLFGAPAHPRGRAGPAEVFGWVLLVPDSSSRASGSATVSALRPSWLQDAAAGPRIGAMSTYTGEVAPGGPAQTRTSPT